MDLGHSILAFHLIDLYSEQTRFSQNLLSYIRLKEKHDFSKMKKAEPKMSRVFGASSNEASSIESDIMLGIQNQRRMTITDRVNEESHEMLWERIEEHLIEHKIFESIDEYLIKYTNILKLHIDHRVKLDKLCTKALVSSVRPSYIEEIFNLNLVDADTDINSLMRNGKIFHDDLAMENFYLNLFYFIKTGKMFTCLKRSLYSSRSTEPFYLIMTISVLLYKISYKQVSQEFQVCLF